jgi:hypothetical protein
MKNSRKQCFGGGGGRGGGGGANDNHTSHISQGLLLGGNLNSH